MVWLVTQTVTLADGSTEQVLVPQLYAVVREGDLSNTGALLSGSSVNLNLSGDLTNTGTIAGRSVVSVAADNINNLGGRITGHDVVAQAATDLNNIGGQISASNSLLASAGRDINVTSTTQSTQTATTSIDRVAGLYVTGANGTLVAAAARDMNLTAATISSAGTATLQAAGSLNLQALTQSQSINTTRDASNYTRMAQSQSVGTTVQASHNVTLSAGQDLTATAASINSTTGDTLLAAGNNVNLLAGSNSTSLATASYAKRSGMFGSGSTRMRNSGSSVEAVVNRLSGNNLSVIAGQNLTSYGTQFQAQNSLYVEGKDTSAFYAVSNATETQSSFESSSSFLGIKLESKAVNDSLQSSLALGSQLVSQNKIDVGVGNQASFSGADIQAPQISFTQTDPSKAGELILGGSINTTQTSHTEKNVSAGVWQEMSGHGSTVQTLNQTSLNGNVSFDSALKITAQIPDTKGGQALKSQINALLTQGNGVGLDYLNALAANPNVQWDKVALANEHWSYSQQGLTPAGAALLSIAVAAYAPGLGNSLTGSITSAAGASTAAALNAGFVALQAQAAVAMVNNGGDIGKTLSQLGSSDSIKGLLTTMVTAGALNSLDQALGFTNSTPTATGQTGAGSLGANGVATSQAANQFGQNLLKNITNNVAAAAIDAAISGKPFNADSLSKALSGALITAGMAAGANAIGDAAAAQNGQPAQIDTFTQKIAHAILGCAGGAAMAGNSNGCSAGAVGAVVGELTAEYAKDAKLSDANTLALAKVVSAAAGVLVGITWLRSMLRPLREKTPY